MDLLHTAVVLTLLFYVNSVHSCPNDCSGNGLCNNDICTCYAGYFEKDCSQNIKNTNATELIIIQAIAGSIFFIISILCSIALYSVLAKQNVTVPIVQNIRAIVFASSLVMAVTQLIVALDPLQVWGILNTVSRFLLNATVYPFTLVSFVAILFHWIDLINISLAALRREMMLQKISVREYKPKDVTVEDMVDKLHFLGTLKPHFIIIVTSMFLFTYATQSIAAIYPSRRRAMRLACFSVDAILLIVCAFGFLHYRRKLIRVMPSEITPKVKKLTARLTLLTVFLFVALVVLFFSVILVSRNSAAEYLALWFVIQLVAAFLCFALPAVFFQWKSRFPFISFSSGSSGQTTQSYHHTDSIEAAVVKSASDDVEGNHLQAGESLNTDVQVIEEQ